MSKISKIGLPTFDTTPLLMMLLSSCLCVASSLGQAPPMPGPPPNQAGPNGPMGPGGPVNFGGPPQVTLGEAHYPGNITASSTYRTARQWAFATDDELSEREIEVVRLALTAPPRNNRL
jgi:hypothetical protein